MMKNKFLACLFIIILQTIPVRNLVLPLCAEDISNEASVAAQGEVELSAEQKLKKAKEYYLIGKQLIQQGNYSAADEEFKKAQQLLKESSSTATNKTQPVLVTMPSLPQVSPPPQPALQSPVAKAWEVAKKGGLEQAILQYLKAIELEPENPNLHYNLAIEYLKTNQFMKASEAFKRVIQLDPKDKDAYYNLGVLYESYLGDKKQAIAYYTKYIKLTSRKEYTSQVRAWIRQIKAESKRK